MFTPVSCTINAKASIKHLQANFVQFWETEKLSDTIQSVLVWLTPPSWDFKVVQTKTLRITSKYSLALARLFPSLWQTLQCIPARCDRVISTSRAQTACVPAPRLTEGRLALAGVLLRVLAVGPLWIGGALEALGGNGSLVRHTLPHDVAFPPQSDLLKWLTTHKAVW